MSCEICPTVHTPRALRTVVGVMTKCKNIVGDVRLPRIGYIRLKHEVDRKRLYDPVGTLQDLLTTIRVLASQESLNMTNTTRK